MLLTRSYNNAKLQQLKLRSVSVDSYKPIKPKLFLCSSRHNYDIIKQVKEVKVTSTVLVVLRRPSSPAHTRWAATLQTAIDYNLIYFTENHHGFTSNHPAIDTIVWINFMCDLVIGNGR